MQTSIHMKTTIPTPLRTIFTVGSITVLGALSTQAAVVSYDITNLNATPVAPSIVVNNPGETILGALNLGGGASRPTGDRVINGVTFELAERAISGSKTFTSGLQIAWVGDETLASSNITRTGITGRYEGDFFEIITNTMQSAGNGSISLTLSGLQEQQAYRVQFLIDDLARTTTDLGMSIVATGTDSGSTGSFTYGMSGGKSVLATFTTGADQTSIGFSLVAASGSRSVINALAVTAIPEPGSAALLLGIGALALPVLRRRR